MWAPSGTRRDRTPEASVAGSSLAGARKKAQCRDGYVEGVDEEAITIRLTRDQAFVLSDWLYQVMFQSDDLEGIVRDRAVWSPIYTISGTLDTTLSEIFMPDYAERLDAAKGRLRVDLYGDADGPDASGRDADAAPQAHQIERGAAGNHGESS